LDIDLSHSKVNRVKPQIDLSPPKKAPTFRQGLHFQLLAQDVEAATQAAGLDHQAVWEEARSEAWRQQKDAYLKGRADG